MITTICRASYAHVFEPAQTPSGDMKYSISLMIPKDDIEGLKAIEKAIEEAIAKGLAVNKFPTSAVPRLRKPLRDGDAEFESGQRDAAYKGFYFLNAGNKNQPGIVDQNVQPIIDPMEFYSGCWCRADINFFPYNTAGNLGIGVGLNNLQKVKDDDRLDGRQKAEDAFDAVGTGDETEESMPNTDGV